PVSVLLLDSVLLRDYSKRVKRRRTLVHDDDHTGHGVRHGHWWLAGRPGPDTILAPSASGDGPRSGDDREWTGVRVRPAGDESPDNACRVCTRRRTHRRYGRGILDLLRRARHAVRRHNRGPDEYRR